MGPQSSNKDSTAVNQAHLEITSSSTEDSPGLVAQGSLQGTPTGKDSPAVNPIGLQSTSKESPNVDPTRLVPVSLTNRLEEIQDSPHCK